MSFDTNQSTVDPDHIDQKQQDLAEAKKVVIGDAPVMERPPDGKITLSFGLLNGDSYEKDATVRELTGADEEALAKYTSTVEVIDAMLCLATERVGSKILSDMPFSERQSVLGPLLAGDRELLFLNVIATTYGDARDVPYTCPHCESSNEVTVIISEDFKPKLKDELLPSYEYVTSKGSTIVYRLSNGFDQLALARKKGLSQPQVNSLILSECILTVDGDPPLAPMEFVRNMGLKDRRTLLEQLTDRQPSIDMLLRPNCPSCGEEVTLDISWEDVFQF